MSIEEDNQLRKRTLPLHRLARFFISLYFLFRLSVIFRIISPFSVGRRRTIFEIPDPYLNFSGWLFASLVLLILMTILYHFIFKNNIFYGLYKNLQNIHANITIDLIRKSFLFFLILYSGEIILITIVRVFNLVHFY